MTNIKNKNRKGQIILFAVVGVTIALAIGVAVASNNLSSLSRVSRSDTSERAFAAAEGGIEKLLLLSGSELDGIANLTTGACNVVSGTLIAGSGVCRITYSTESGDPITSTADLKVEHYTTNQEYSGTPYLALNINNGDTVEVSLSDIGGGNKFNGTLELCWENQEAALYYSLNKYYSSCNCDRGALRSNVGFSAVGNTSTKGFVDVSATKYGSSKCHTFTLTGTYDSLRIKSMYAETLVGIFPSGTGILPNQGYKLTSYGKVSSSGSNVIKKVVAYRSYPFMPGIFDSAIFSPNGQIN